MRGVSARVTTYTLHGYVDIVLDTELGERVTVTITKVRENLACSVVVKRDAY